MSLLQRGCGIHVASAEPDRPQPGEPGKTGRRLSVLRLLTPAYPVRAAHGSRRLGLPAPPDGGSMKPAGPVIGVLALQGDVPEHLRALESAGARPAPVR